MRASWDTNMDTERACLRQLLTCQILVSPGLSEGFLSSAIRVIVESFEIFLKLSVVFSRLLTISVSSP